MFTTIAPLPSSGRDPIPDRARFVAKTGHRGFRPGSTGPVLWPLDTHPNHHAVNPLVWQCYRRKGGWNLYFFEVMTDQQTLAFQPSPYLDIGPVREVKRKSLDQHKSQEPEAIWQVHDRMHRRRGTECGVEFAEAYSLVEPKAGCPLLPVTFLGRKP